MTSKVKKTNTVILSVLLVIAMLFTIMPTNVNAATAVTVTATKNLNLKKVTSSKYTASVKTTSVKPTFTVKYGKTNVTSKANKSSSNKTIATINSKGQITIKKAGKVTFTIKYKTKVIKVITTITKPQHTHSWVKKVVGYKHHDAVYGMRQVEVLGKKIAHYACSCGKDFTSPDEWGSHALAVEISGGYPHSYTPYDVQEPSTYKTEKYVVKKAYDEPIYQTKCSKCGKIK